MYLFILFCLFLSKLKALHAVLYSLVYDLPGSSPLSSSCNFRGYHVMIALVKAFEYTKEKPDETWKQIQQSAKQLKIQYEHTFIDTLCWTVHLRLRSPK